MSPETAARDRLEPGGSPVVVSTAWLAEHLELAAGPALRIVDVRGQVLPPGSKPRYLGKRVDYDAGHVPGAVFVDWTRDIVDLHDPVPAQIAPPDVFAAKMTELGIGAGTLVVAYDDHHHVFAGRLAWALRYYGHDAVRILDGGFTRWVAEGRAITTDLPHVTSGATGGAKPAGGANVASGPFVARPRAELRRTADAVSASLGRPDTLLIDARPPAQYEGAVSAAARSGHIPGARNVPYATLVDPSTGQFLSPPDLAGAFAKAGVDVTALPREIIVYCNGGVSCSVALSALRMLGRDEVAVYDGSWNEWGSDESRPIRTGSAP